MSLLQLFMQVCEAPMLSVGWAAAISLLGGHAYTGILPFSVRFPMLELSGQGKTWMQAVLIKLRNSSIKVLGRWKLKKKQNQDSVACNPITFWNCHSPPREVLCSQTVGDKQECSSPYLGPRTLQIFTGRWDVCDLSPWCKKSNTRIISQQRRKGIVRNSILDKHTKKKIKAAKQQISGRVASELLNKPPLFCSMTVSAWHGFSN